MFVSLPVVPTMNDTSKMPSVPLPFVFRNLPCLLPSQGLASAPFQKFLRLTSDAGKKYRMPSHLHPPLPVAPLDIRGNEPRTTYQRPR